MEKKNVWNIAINIFHTIIVFCILILVILLILSELSPASLCESLCNYHNGTFWMATDCEGDVMACSGFCNYGNKSIFCNELLDEINSSISYG